MATLAAPAVPSIQLWIGRSMSTLFVLFMAAASIAPKLLGMDVAAETLVSLGWPPRHVLLIGLLELTFTVLYVVPRTSVLGAMLMTGLLGGAMATHIRAESPLFSHVFFSLYLAVFMWGGLWLRSPALRAVLPVTYAKEMAQ